MKYSFNALARQLPESYDYGVGSHMQAGIGIVGTEEQRLEFARRMFRRPQNMLEYERVARTILLGVDAGLVQPAILQWPNSPDVLAEWDRLETSKEEIVDGLPSKAKMGRDIYNLASDTQVATDDRLKAFRLYGELQGHIGSAKTQINNNIDARSVILVPSRSRTLDDPDREAKVIEAQARLVKDASRP